MNMGDVRTSLSDIRLRPFSPQSSRLAVRLYMSVLAVLRGFASEERQREAAAGWW